MRHRNGYTKKEIIALRECNSLQELLEAIEYFISVSGNRDASTIYLEDGQGENVNLRLIENTLTDGAVVYDARLS